MYCRCPKCKKINEANSKDFGKIFQCYGCKHRVVLDVEHLAHFNLPKVISIQLTGENIDSQKVLVNYGYQLPILFTDNRGKVQITNEMICKAKPEDCWNRGDDSLNRYVEIVFPDFDGKKLKIDLENVQEVLNLELAF